MLKKFSFAMVIALALVTSFGTLPAGAAVSEDIGGVGDLLLGYLYDVRETAERNGSAWENFLVIQNTTNRWVAGHLRFRSYEKSIEVWDHVILLSPYDVFWLGLAKSGDTGVAVYSDDTETLRNSGMIKKTETSYASAFNPLRLKECGYNEIGDRMLYGHFEFIGLWSWPDTEAAALAEGVTKYTTSHDFATAFKAIYGAPVDRNDVGEVADGEENIFDVMLAEWGNKGGWGDAIPTEPVGIIDCPNVLVGSMELGDTVTAQYNLYNLVAAKDFRTYQPAQGAPYVHRDGLRYGAISYPRDIFKGLPYGTTAEVSVYYQPDWATTTGAILRDGDAAGANEPCAFTWISNAAYSLKEFEAAFFKGQVWDFFMNGAFGADIVTDLALTFPGKYLHFLHIVGTCAAIVDEWPMYDNPVGVSLTKALQDYKADRDAYLLGSGATPLSIKARWDKIDNGPINIGIGEIFNLDQETPEGLPVEESPIPIPVIGQDIPEETNVLRLLVDLFNADDFFVDPAQEPFESGQFTIGTFRYPSTQQRDYADNTELLPGLMGATTRIHNSGGSAVYRSTMAPIHWKADEQ